NHCGSKGNPAQIARTRWIVDFWRKVSVGKAVSQVHANCRRLSHDNPIVHQRGQLAHWVRSPKLGAALLLLIQVDVLELIRDTQFFKHPNNASRTGEGMMVECQIFRVAHVFDTSEWASRSKSEIGAPTRTT